MTRAHGIRHGNLRILAATLILIGSAAQVMRVTSHADLGAGYRWFAMAMGVGGALLSIALLLSRAHAVIALAMVKAFLSVTAPALGPDPDALALVSTLVNAGALLALVAVWESSHRTPTRRRPEPAWLRTSPTSR